jgi:hypothetical protein
MAAEHGKMLHAHCGDRARARRWRRREEGFEGKVARGLPGGAAGRPGLRETRLAKKENVCGQHHKTEPRLSLLVDEHIRSKTVTHLEAGCVWPTAGVGWADARHAPGQEALPPLQQGVKRSAGERRWCCRTVSNWVSPCTLTARSRTGRRRRWGGRPLLGRACLLCATFNVRRAAHSPARLSARVHSANGKGNLKGLGHQRMGAFRVLTFLHLIAWFEQRVWCKKRVSQGQG